MASGDAQAFPGDPDNTAPRRLCTENLGFQWLVVACLQFCATETLSVNSQWGKRLHQSDWEEDREGKSNRESRVRDMIREVLPSLPPHREEKGLGRSSPCSGGGNYPRAWVPGWDFWRPFQKLLHNDFVPGRSGWRRPAGTWPSALEAPGILWGGDTDLGLNSML